MLTRRDLLIIGGFLAPASWRSALAATAHQKTKPPKLATVTLAITGMT